MKCQNCKVFVPIFEDVVQNSFCPECKKPMKNVGVKLFYETMEQHDIEIEKFHQFYSHGIAAFGELNSIKLNMTSYMLSMLITKNSK